MASKGDYKTFKPTIDRILNQAKQEADFQKRLKLNSPEYRNAIEKRATKLAGIEKQRLTKNFNVKTGIEFYRLFKLDLTEFTNKFG